MPVARGDFLCIGERVEIPGRWEDKGARGGMEIRLSRSEMQGMLIKKQALVKLLKSIVISDFRAMRR